MVHLYNEVIEMLFGNNFLSDFQNNAFVSIK